MSGKKGKSFWHELGEELKDVWQLFQDSWSNTRVHIRNTLLDARQARIPYVMIPLEGSYIERAGPPRSFIERQLPLPLPSPSLEHLTAMLHDIEDADNVRGVIFVNRGLSVGLGMMQSIRQSMQRLRESGKHVVMFAHYLEAVDYYLAAAADLIVVPPGTEFAVLGLYSEITFLKNALAQVGLLVDVVQISPYKSGADNLSQADISPEYQEQLDWLYDDIFDMLTADIAAERNMTQEAFQTLLNHAPFSAEEAKKKGLIDFIGYEDDLAGILAGLDVTDVVKDTAAGETAVPDDAEEERTIPPAIEVTDDTEALETIVDDETPAGDLGAGEFAAEEAEVEEQEEHKPLKIFDFHKAYPLLKRKHRRRSRKFIGVINIDGPIILGSSNQPLPIDLPLPLLAEGGIGNMNIQRLFRRVEGIEEMAALVLHVDSPGGASLAAELIGREVERLDKRKPVVVYMSNTAASGGYYISAPARHIVCQPMTFTGSIGVYMLRISTAGVYDKIAIKRVINRRGARAGLYRGSEPLTKAERELLWESVKMNYTEFKQVVAQGRGLPVAELDPICEGRVWTGRQALGHKLVDSHGSFRDAVRCAAELSGLPTDDGTEIPVVNFNTKIPSHITPKPFPAGESIARLLNGEAARALSGKLMMHMPFTIRFW